jgi:CRP/FNR family cyclic AMP-dependent transcriptional regulator
VASPSVDTLKKVPLFEDIEGRDLRNIAESFKQRTFNAGDTISSEGKGAAGFFVIESGIATVTVGGREVGTMKAGDYFGEIALIDQGARTATVTAQTDLHTYGMTFWEFRPIVENNSQLAWKLLQALAKKLREAELRAQPST